MEEKKMMEWLEWLRECYEEATLSPDTSTQLGAMLVPGMNTPWRGDSLSLLRPMAHNGFTEGWEVRAEDLERPRKYQIIEHAERGVIYKAAKLGWPTEDATMVCTWAACTDCARAIVQAGISILVRHYPPLDEATERWLESVSLGDDILKAGGVQIVDYIGNVPGAPSILRSGELFDPSGGVLV